MLKSYSYLNIDFLGIFLFIIQIVKNDKKLSKLSKIVKKIGMNCAYSDYFALY